MNRSNEQYPKQKSLEGYKDFHPFIQVKAEQSLLAGVA